MRERNHHLTTRKFICPFLLIALVIVCMAGAKPVFAAQSASDALDAAFVEDEDDWTFDEEETQESADTASDAEEAVTTADTLSSDAGRFIFDDNNLDESQVAALDAQAQQLYDKYGIGIYFGEDNTDSDQDAITRAEAFYQENCAITDGVMLFLTSDEYYVYLSGRAEHIFTDEEIDQIWTVFVTDNTYYDEGISDYLSYMGQVMENHGLQVIPSERQKPLLVDDADLLSEWEEEDLLEQLTSVSNKEQMDVAVVTVNSLDGKTPEAYADDYYDYNGYGQGENNDGVLLLISMEERDWHVSTTGFGITAVNDAAIELIEERVVSHLSDGDYYGAFTSYCSTVDEVAEMARNGEPYTGGLSWSKKQIFGASGILSVILGFGIGMIATARQKKNLKRVRRQHGATAYIYGDASHLSVSDDRFIRRNVVRTRIPQDDDHRGGGGGGSTIHFGGSGTMHGGGGGKF